MDKDLKMGERLGNGFDYLLKALAVLGFICVLITMFIMSAEVIMRYFFNSPLGWSVEISSYLLVYICFLVVPYVLKNERHVTMDIVYIKISEDKRVYLDLISSFLMMIISLIITRYSWKVTWDLFQSGLLVHGTVEIPKFVIVGIILPSGILLFLESARKARRHLIRMADIKKGRE